ncbi:hypothetical protein TNCV_5121 [Trichonephila clavipes]|nr:hypothetical protein TNCV_5121 [Trichonephila clavipes]
MLNDDEIVTLVQEESDSETDEDEDNTTATKVARVHRITQEHGATPLRVKEDIEDVSSELGNEGSRLHFLDETSRTILLSASWDLTKPFTNL